MYTNNQTHLSTERGSICILSNLSTKFTTWVDFYALSY